MEHEKQEDRRASNPHSKRSSPARQCSYVDHKPSKHNSDKIPERALVTWLDV